MLKSVCQLQQNRFFQKNFRIRQFANNSVGGLILEKLASRALLKIEGIGSSDLLQGLITNDINHLKDANSSMYTLFLNNKGRVLADTIIYRTTEPNTFLIELDSNVTSRLERHLKTYILRKKIKVINVDSLNSWVLFNPENQLLHQPPSSSYNIYKDPRSAYLGLRIITPADEKADMISKTLCLSQSTHSMTYKQIRYRLGIGEGSIELPPEKCLPLEVNGDYLHGISFTKGCYLGQELTARTYHLGVVRKRLMPLKFVMKTSTVPEIDEAVVTPEDKTSVGKYRGSDGNYGIALLRIDNVLKSKELFVNDWCAVTERPKWWPIQAPKERKEVVEKH